MDRKERFWHPLVRRSVDVKPEEYGLPKLDTKIRVGGRTVLAAAQGGSRI